MNELFGHSSDLGLVAAKAALLFLAAVAGLRFSRRRTLAEMSAFDFVAAIAIGAIVGRVPNASTTSFVEGAVTLVTILVVHSIVTWLRFVPRVSRLVDHPPLLLVAAGRIDRRAMRRCGMTDADLDALLRRQGVTALSSRHYVIFERRGDVSIIEHESPPKLENAPSPAHDSG